MNRPIVLAGIAAICASVWAQQTLTSGPWTWQETSAGLRLELAGKPFITRELVQLIDLSAGWTAVYQNAGKDAGPETSRLADGREGTRSVLGGRLKLSRETWAEQDTLHISITCEITDPGPATSFYYSLEFPASVLARGAWRAQSQGWMTGAEILEAPASGPLAEGFAKLELLGQPGLIAIEADAHGATWSFQEWRRAPHDAYRLRIQLPAKPGVRWQGELALKLAEGNPPDVTEFLTAVREAAAKRLSLAHEEKLAFRSLECLTPRPQVGRMCELRADIGCAYDDPFNPSDVDVTATIKTPSRSYTLPAFYHIPFARERTEADESVTSRDPEWRIRFLPAEPGKHEVTLRLRDRAGQLTSPPTVIDVAPADWQGLLRVSKTSPLALVWDSGKPFYPLGINVFDRTQLGKPLPPDRIDRCLGQIERLARAGGNFIRLRMDSWWFAIDNPVDAVSGYMGAGRLNQRACWDIDRILEACERLGVQVMLCIENANANVNSPREAWRRRYNVYAKDNGGPCETMAESWTDESARELVKRKIRYCVARWGASPSLAMWEFFNEVVIGGRVDAGPVIAWHDEMAREFKRLDPHKRLVTTSPMGERDSEANARLWQVEALDIAQVHDYGHANTSRVYHTAQHGAEAFGKPFIVGEFGMRGGEVRSGRFKHASDTEGLVAHLGHWSSAMSLAAGAPLDWYIANYVDALDLWEDFTRLRDFLADLPRTDPALKPLQVESISLAPGHILKQPADAALAPVQKWEKSPCARYVVNDDGALTPPEGLNGFLWGTQNHPDLRNPPTFVLNCPQPFRFVAHVMEVVGRGSNPVRITVDGNVALEEDLVCEEGKGDRWEVRQPGPQGNVAVWYNRDLAVEVPAGEHEVRIENLGKDRLALQYRLEGYATREKTPEIMAVGLQHTSGAHLWIHNQSWSAEAILGWVNTVPAREVRIALRGLRDGRVDLQWSDPMTGQLLRTQAATIRKGGLELRVPELQKDLACKIRYQ